MIVLKGAEVTARIKQQVEEALSGWKGEVPKLAIVRVGERPDDVSYEKGALKRMGNFGLRVESFVFDQDISDAEFKTAFAQINEPGYSRDSPSASAAEADL